MKASIELLTRAISIDKEISYIIVYYVREIVDFFQERITN